MKRRPAYALRRVWQTATEFENGPKLLGQMALHRLSGRPRELVYRLPDQTRIRCTNLTGGRLPIYEVLIDDTYDLGAIAPQLGPNPVILDIGAHIGSFSIAVSRYCPEARIEAFEASATTAGYLKANIAANGLDDRVRVHNVAVAAAAGHVEFIDNGAGSVHNGMVSPERATPVRVPSITFTQAAAEAGPRIDLVKIDAEGAEYDFILASSPADWTGVQRVVMEYHNVRGHRWDELEEFFARTPLRVNRRAEESERLGLVWLAQGSVS